MGFMSKVNLNQNIWCIEIYKDVIFRYDIAAWTKTYDVLKWWISHIKESLEMLEPKHMMYWNPWVFPSLNIQSWLEPKHMMYWNFQAVAEEIEHITWTKTYDVLKL